MYGFTLRISCQLVGHRMLTLTFPLREFVNVWLSLTAIVPHLQLVSRKYLRYKVVLLAESMALKSMIYCQRRKTKILLGYISIA